MFETNATVCNANHFVIPAKAGIQLVKNPHACPQVIWLGEVGQNPGFCPLRGIYFVTGFPLSRDNQRLARLRAYPNGY
jgi:hypothetical protein